MDEVIGILNRLHVPQVELDMFKLDCQTADGKKMNRNHFIPGIVMSGMSKMNSFSWKPITRKLKTFMSKSAVDKITNQSYSSDCESSWWSLSVVISLSKSDQNSNHKWIKCVWSCPSIHLIQIVYSMIGVKNLSLVKIILSLSRAMCFLCLEMIIRE